MRFCFYKKEQRIIFEPNGVEKRTGIILPKRVVTLKGFFNNMVVVLRTQNSCYLDLYTGTVLQNVSFLVYFERNAK